MIWAFVLSGLRKYWKPLAVVGGIVLVLGGVYLKGRLDKGKAINEATKKETIRRYETLERTTERTGRKTDEIQRDRLRTPTNDQRDSCLLSKNPLYSHCLGL